MDNLTNWKLMSREYKRTPHKNDINWTALKNSQHFITKYLFQCKLKDDMERGPTKSAGMCLENSSFEQKQSRKSLVRNALKRDLEKEKHLENGSHFSNLGWRHRGKKRSEQELHSFSADDELQVLVGYLCLVPDPYEVHLYCPVIKNWVSFIIREHSRC